MLYAQSHMTEKMLKFVKLGKQNPTKREVVERKEDFNEIYKEFINEKAKEQSSRCSQCGVPFCQVHCPLSNNIPDWLKLTAEGRLKEAYELAQSTNNMPEVCGRICPQDRLCEGNCVIEQSGHGTVTIGSVEKFITENAWENKWVKPIKIKLEKDQTVGIIGAGPAGLACAEQLRKQGYQITIYDRYDRPGGLLIYGIPNFKLEKFVVERRTKLLKESGIKFIQNFEIGQDATIDELKEKHDAILIATGVYKAREIEIPGNDLGNIFPAMDFLTASNKKGLGDKVEQFDNGTLNVDGKDVIVIGGGDTGSDCIGTSNRHGAKSVVNFEIMPKPPGDRSPSTPWPYWPLQLKTSSSHKEGVERNWLINTKEFITDENGKLTALKTVRVEWKTVPGQRPQLIEVEGTEKEWKCELALLALGFTGSETTISDQLGIKHDARTNIEASENDYKTNVPGVFAAGDQRRGQSLIVWAISEGRQAAHHVDKYLMGSSSLPLKGEGDLPGV